MRNKIILTVSILSIAFIATSAPRVRAETGSYGLNTGTTRSDMQDKNKEIRGEQEKEATMKAREEKRALLASLFGKKLGFFQRFDEKTEKIYSLDGRIEMVIDKLKAQGKDVTVLETKLSAAEDLIASAKKSLSDAAALKKSGAKPADLMPKLKEARDNFEKAKTALMEIVRSIKDLIKNNNDKQ